mmetsp:Transcript_20257/g.44933  ORF Transcript_20257/g.44933 Transcript_20257/m.44933 type:complete len:758 (+) Transcript_20257:173-2446(+)
MAPWIAALAASSTVSDWLQPHIDLIQAVGNVLEDPLNIPRTDFILKCELATNVGEIEFLPLSSVGRICDTTDEVLECKSKWRDGLETTFKGNKKFQTWCGDFYDWFLAKYGKLCPGQCIKLACSPHCAFSENIQKLLATATELNGLADKIDLGKKTLREDWHTLGLTRQSMNRYQRKLESAQSKEDFESKKLNELKTQEEAALKDAKNRTRAAEEERLHIKALKQKSTEDTTALGKENFEFEETDDALKGKKEEFTRYLNEKKREQLEGLKKQQDSKVQSLKKQEATLKGNVSDLDTANNNTAKDYADQRAATDHNHEEAANLTRALEDANKALKAAGDAEQHANATRFESRTAYFNLNNTVDDTTEELKNTKANLKDTEDELARHEEYLRVLQEHKDDRNVGKEKIYEGRITEAKAKIETLKKSVSDLETKLSKAKDDRKAMGDKYRKWKAMHEESMENSTRANLTRADLDNKLLVSSKNLTENKEKQGELQVAAKAARDKLALYKNKLSDTQRDLKTAEEQLAETKGELDTLTNPAKIAQYRNDISSLQAKYDNLKDSVGNHTEALNALNKDIKQRDINIKFQKEAAQQSVKKAKALTTKKGQQQQTLKDAAEARAKLQKLLAETTEKEGKETTSYNVTLYTYNDNIGKLISGTKELVTDLASEEDAKPKDMGYDAKDVWKLNKLEDELQARMRQMAADATSGSASRECSKCEAATTELLKKVAKEKNAQATGFLQVRRHVQGSIVDPLDTIFDS